MYEYLLLKLYFSLCIAVSHAMTPACFDRNQAQRQAALPCNPNADVSACCDEGNLCLSNGLCQPNSTQPNGGLTPFYTGYCTDSSWSSSQCLNICNNNPAGMKFSVEDHTVKITQFHSKHYRQWRAAMQ